MKRPQALLFWSREVRQPRSRPTRREEPQDLQSATRKPPVKTKSTSFSQKSARVDTNNSQQEEVTHKGCCEAQTQVQRHLQCQRSFASVAAAKKSEGSEQLYQRAWALNVLEGHVLTRERRVSAERSQRNAIYQRLTSWTLFSMCMLRIRAAG